MTNFQSFYGIVTIIDDFLVDQTTGKDGCYKLVSVETSTSYVLGKEIQSG